MACLISVRGVGHRFEGSPSWCFRSLSFEIRAGQAIAFVGPSGCGKSTLLRIVGGLLRPTEGTVSWLGAPPHPHAKCAFMFQESRLLPWRTAIGNIVIACDRGALTRTERLEKARRMLVEVRIGDLARRYPRTLSGGQKQRVALARTLARDAPVLLLDEPFSALDTATRLHMIAVAKKQLACGGAVVLVTHDLSDAELLDARVLNVGASSALEWLESSEVVGG